MTFWSRPCISSSRGTTWFAPNARGNEGGGKEGVSTYLPGTFGLVEGSETVDDAELDALAESWKARLVVANPAALTATRTPSRHADEEEVAEDVLRASAAVRAIERCTPIFDRVIISDLPVIFTILLSVATHHLSPFPIAALL